MTAPALLLPSASPPALTLASLRTQLDVVVAGGRKAGAPWTTGIPALDHALGGGVPRGRITEVVGALGAGKTSLVHRIMTRVLHSGGWVAWIDARRTLAPAPLANVGERVVVIRPHDTKRSAWTADLLLRSGVFALVVLDGAPPLSRVHGVRLAQLARERDAACVVLSHDTRPSRVSGAVRVRIESRAHVAHASSSIAAHDNARCMAITVEKGAININSTSKSNTTTAAHPMRTSVRSIEVHHVIVVARRVCTDSEIRDRRGVARSTRRPWAANGGTPGGGSDVEHSVTWGGLSVGTGRSADQQHVDTIYGTLYATRSSTDRDAAGTGVPRSDAAERDATERDATERDRTRDSTRERDHGQGRDIERGFDRTTRDWTRYRGRRRAAESTYGRPTRRERARERVGTPAIGAPLGRHATRTRG